jgi:predicted MFS family arabinose efflux permease
LSRKRLLTLILTLTAARLVINMTRRFSYPFLPAISRNLDVPLSYAQNVVAVQSGAGLASPLFSPLSYRFGHKRVMLSTLLVMAGASFLGAIAPTFAIFAILMLVYGVVKMIYDPTMQAYLSEIVSYRRRGLALGLTELSWAGALVVIAPVAALLLGEIGLEAVFLFFGICTSAAFLLVWRLIPAREKPAEGESVPAPITPRLAWQTMKGSPVALAALAYSLLLVTANEMLFISYGVWMEDTFGLALAALGTATIVIAAAEVVGEFTVIGLSDHTGKRNMALGGALVAGVMYGVMPLLSFHLVAALAGLFVLFIGVELAIVASIPFFSEILPHARTTMLSSNISAHSAGRLFGALLGAFLFGLTDSFALVSVVAMVIGLVAFGVMALLLREHEDEKV